jgi:hypothetical protein
MTLLSDFPILSLTAVGLLVLLVLFMIRVQAHQLIHRSSRLLNSQLRLLSRACLNTAQRIRFRNHEVTKSLAEALMERQMERRFMRIEKLVERDINSYQLLAAAINQQLASIDEDYVNSAQVPEVSAEWVSAVEAIACLTEEKRSTDVVSKILEDMHNTIQQHQRDALREQRWTVTARHKVLSRLHPQWRRLHKLLQRIDNNIEVLRYRLRQVDQHMGQFEMLTAGSGQGIMSSMLMRFVSSLCFVMVGVAAGWINWQLLHQPLTELLPVRPLGAFSMAGVVAWLHIGITIIAATLITESLRITHLFPLVTAMTRRGRQGMVFVGSVLLLALTSMEALALFGAPLSVESVLSIEVSQVLLVMLGIVMPLMLSLIMVPMEYMLHTVRPVLGSFIQQLLHVMALAFRLFSSLSLQLGKLLIHGYDLVIFVPLLMQRDMKNRQQRASNVVENSEPQVATVEAEPVNVTTLKFGPMNNENRH